MEAAVFALLPCKLTAWFISSPGNEVHEKHVWARVLVCVEPRGRGLDEMLPNAPSSCLASTESRGPEQTPPQFLPQPHLPIWRAVQSELCVKSVGLLCWSERIPTPFIPHRVRHRVDRGGSTFWSCQVVEGEERHKFTPWARKTESLAVHWASKPSSVFLLTKLPQNYNFTNVYVIAKREVLKPHLLQEVLLNWSQCWNISLLIMHTRRKVHTHTTHTHNLTKCPTMSF